MHLFCSDESFAEYGRRWRELAPGLEHVGLPEGRRLEPEEIERIDIAAFTGDLWQSGRSPAFFKVLLQAPNLRWLHLFSAGTDAPVFQQIMQRGVRVTNSAGAAARPIAHSVISRCFAVPRRPALGIDQAYKAWQRHHPDVRPPDGRGGQGDWRRGGSPRSPLRRVIGVRHRAATNREMAHLTAARTHRRSDLVLAPLTGRDPRPDRRPSSLLPQSARDQRGAAR
jgi:lactate dehydrogenase-like 2-hydroxyacid dehydrogenase